MTAEDEKHEVAPPPAKNRQSVAGKPRNVRWPLVIVSGVIGGGAVLLLLSMFIPAPEVEEPEAPFPAMPGQLGPGLAELSLPVERMREIPVDAIPGPDVPLPNTSDELIKEAEQVAQWFSECLPNDPDGYEVQARLRYWLGDPQGAVELWKRSLEINPDYVHAHFGMGLVAADNGDFEEAVQRFEKAVQRTPQAAATRAQLASALINQGEFQRAVEVLEETARTSPDPASTTNMMGIAHRQLKNYEEARKWYEASLEADPHDATVHVALAAICSQLGDEQQAKVHTRRGRELMDAERTERKGARGKHDDLAEMAGKLAAIYTTAGEICAGMGQFGACERLWRRAGRLSSRDLQSRRFLFTMYREAGNLEGAVSVLEELAERESKNILHLLELGRLYPQLNRIEDAERVFEKVMKQMPERSDGHAGLVQLYLWSGRKLERALELAEQATLLDSVPLNYYLLALARDRNGDRPGARQAIKSARELAPDDPLYREAERELLKGE